ncbi:hypothetical protein ACQUW5_09595 [Legionella sp. CNM-1927-20]|uniref:hypothetical protein n=1 Tax=Legionella sp. CNM-1927-20 TaxID=3422221 RepID=UPI00403AC281
MLTFILEQDQDTELSIRYIIIKESNVTVYYKGFDELLIMMDVADELEKNSRSSLTYVIDHTTEERAIYHEGIDKDYSDDGHYHFRRKDKLVLTLNDIQLLLDILHDYLLLTKEQHRSLLKQIQEPVKSNGISTRAFLLNVSFFANLQSEELENGDYLAETQQRDHENNY